MLLGRPVVVVVVVVVLAIAACSPFGSAATALPATEEAGTVGDADVPVDAGDGSFGAGSRCLEAAFSDDFEGASLHASWSAPASSSRASMSLSKDASAAGTGTMKATVNVSSGFGGGSYLGMAVSAPCVTVDFSLRVPVLTKGRIDIFQLEIVANDAPILITARLTGPLLKITERAAAGSFYAALVDVDVSPAPDTWTKVSIHYDATPSLTLRLNDVVYPLTTLPSRRGSLVKGLRLGVVDADAEGEGVFFFDDVSVR